MALDQIAHGTSTLLFRRSMYGHLNPDKQPLLFWTRQQVTEAGRLGETDDTIAVPAPHSVQTVLMAAVWGCNPCVAVFLSPRQALYVAIDLQQRCWRSGGEPLGLRVGLDAGELIVGEGGTYRGSALNVAARLCRVAQAREILASQAVIHLAQTVSGLSYRDRGVLALRELPDPIRVFQVLTIVPFRQQVQTTEQPGQPTVTPKTRCDSITEALDSTASAHIPDGEGSGRSEIEYARRELENALQSALCRPWPPLAVKSASAPEECPGAGSD